jgi:transmembrane sensor
VILRQGQQGSFSRQGPLTRRPLDANQDAWTHGLLVANEQRLDQVVAQLARYRQGWLRCAPSVSGLHVSGTFPLDDSDMALRALASSLPVRIEQRTRYWVTVQPA